MKAFCFVTLELGAFYKNNVTVIAMTLQSEDDNNRSTRDIISTLIFM